MLESDVSRRCLGYWKGSLFESLQQSGIFDGLAVDPMASDLSSWRDDDFRLFARLLRIGTHQIIRHRASLTDRRRYFEEIEHEGDLFLDPDTGVATGPVARPKQYVMPGEVSTLLQARDRVVVVYQHVRAQRVRVRVDAVLSALSPTVGPAGWCSYESGTVAMLFLARTAACTSAVTNHFRGVLGRHAKGRIRSGMLVA